MKPTRVALIIVATLAILSLMAFVVNRRLGTQALPTADKGEMERGLTVVDMGAEEGGSRLPVLSEKMPEFAGIAEWLNSPPLTTADLKGKVVLIDFWTYSCINCIRTLPYVTAWFDRYGSQGFVVIGVHTPEFAFEKEAENVRDAIKRHGISYPVPLDNEYETWDNYHNRYWPAEYLFDAQGRLRYTHFGEGSYDITEGHIRDLLKEAGMAAEAGMTDIDASAPDFRRIGTHETYIGYGRQEYFDSPEPIRYDEPQQYSVPDTLTRNRFYLGGTWRVESERATLTNAPGELAIRYSASVVNLVMGAESGLGRAEVLLDGRPVPTDLRGADLYVEKGRTYVRVRDERLYNLIDARGVYGEHDLRLRFLDEGVQVYAFTFG